jgi:hypothetical protein
MLNGFIRKYVPVMIMMIEITWAPERIKMYFEFKRINSIKNRSAPARIRYVKNRLPTTEMALRFFQR